MLGPYTSVSNRPTAAPAFASDTAILTATVDLPTPPLPEATAIVFFTPGIGCASERPPELARTRDDHLKLISPTSGSTDSASRISSAIFPRSGHAGVVSSTWTVILRPSITTAG